MTTKAKKKATWLNRQKALEEAVELCLKHKSYNPKKAADKVLGNEEYIKDRPNLTEGGYNLFVQQIEKGLETLKAEV
jgi:hypothetical protein